MSDSILQFQTISKKFFGVQVLKEVTFAVGRGRVMGLIGENGAGKSTLMNILGGVVPVDGGRILLDERPYAPADPRAAARAGIAFIHQELNLFTNLSIAENFFISNFPRVGPTPFLDPRPIQAKAREYLALVDLPIAPDMLVEKLSPGERQLVEVAKALSQDANIIIFDEPTTSLTARETDRLFGLIERLHASGKTIFYISHILRDVQRLADDIAVLRDGELVSVAPKSELTIPKMISLMVGRDIEQYYPKRSARPTDQVALEVQHLSRSGLVHDINFNLHRGEILGVFGLMGSGRSELAQMLFGLEHYDRGQMIVDGRAVTRISPPQSIRGKVAFVTENRREEGLLMNATVSDNLGLVALPNYASRLGNVIKQGTLAAAIRKMVAQLNIRVKDAFKHAAKGLSGGNQQKVVLGKWLMTKPNLLLVDEPTRGVDVGAKYEIYTVLDQIAAAGAAVLFISSEVEELIGMCDRIVVMGNGEILGNFDRPQFDKEAILRMAFRESGE
jgi:ribose transport system ATP-binding protein